MNTILEGGGPTGAATFPTIQGDGVANAAKSPVEIIGRSAAMANRAHGDCCPALALFVLGQIEMAGQAAAQCEGSNAA
jgi:hypothetical protein